MIGRGLLTPWVPARAIQEVSSSLYVCQCFDHLIKKLSGRWDSRSRGAEYLPVTLRSAGRIFADEGDSKSHPS